MPSRKNTNNKNVTAACNESEMAIIAFLLHLSANTPEKGVTIICGINIKNTDIDKTIALPVSIVNHHVIVKPTIREPNIEKFCPPKK
jgi:hypothetical protein